MGRPYTIEHADSPETLAQRFVGDPNRAHELIDENPELAGRHGLSVGEIVSLPDSWMPGNELAADYTSTARGVSESLGLTIAGVASAYAGTGAHRDADRYAELLMGPGDPPSARSYFLSVSSCALFARGVLREALKAHGLIHPILQRAYCTGMAVADVVRVHRDASAWVSPDPDGPGPSAGSVFHIDTPGQNADHVGTVVEVLGPWSFRTVEGGQGLGGTESGAFTRTWKRDGARLFMGSRQVMGWGDPARLAELDPSAITAPACPSALGKGAPPGARRLLPKDALALLVMIGALGYASGGRP